MRLHGKAELKQFETLARIQHAIGFNDRRFAELLGLSPVQLARHRAQNKSLSMNSILRLTSELKLDLESVMYGRVDFTALRKRALKLGEALPDRYTVGAFSKRRTSINILRYLEMFYGWRRTEAILRKLQVDSSAFSDPDRLISIHFISDLCHELSLSGICEKTFNEMGYLSYVLNSKSKLAEELAEESELDRGYEAIFESMMGFFDENHHYRLAEVAADRIVVHSVPRPEVKDALKTRVFGNRWTCQVRSAVGATFACYMGHTPAAATETKCVHRGDPYCVFEFDLSQSRPKQPA